MNWPQIFLGCFVIGFVFSVMSFALGAIGVDLHVHVPFVHHPHVPHGRTGRRAARRRSTSPPSWRFSPGSAAPATC